MIAYRKRQNYLICYIQFVCQHILNTKRTIIVSKNPRPTFAKIPNFKYQEGFSYQFEAIYLSCIQKVHQYYSYQSQMGSSLDKQQGDGEQAKEKFRLNIRMNQDELETLEKIFVERSHFRFPYLCSVAKMMKEEDGVGIFCQSLTRIIIEYEPYDYLLSEVVKNHMMPQVEIEKIIFSVCTALDFLHQKKYRHGDIQPKMICYDKGEWRLIDNCFVKGGITAYEKVLEGEEGFISPAQMQKMRHGFIRQSPPILEADEIFGLGMTCLQLMTGKPSSLCYKQSYLRFNEAALNEKITLVKNTFPQYFSKLVLAMIEMKEQRRIKIKDILTQAFISRHSKKISLKGSLVS